MAEKPGPLALKIKFVSSIKNLSVTMLVSRKLRGTRKANAVEPPIRIRELPDTDLDETALFGADALRFLKGLARVDTTSETSSSILLKVR